MSEIWGDRIDCFTGSTGFKFQIQTLCAKSLDAGRSGCADVVQITPRVSGPIVNLPIRDNQFVKTGTLLFEIDPRTFQASLDQVSASVQQAESVIKEIDSEIEKNKAEFERQQELLPQRATSQKSVERAEANYEVSLEKRKGALASLA
ncbi:MAG: HlyD family secretion protein, partial [Planctomycetota bacterium]